MPVLHLGVLDQPYAQGQDAAEPTRKAKRSGSAWRRRDLIGGEVSTTADVAKIIEGRYGVLAAFMETEGQKVADALADSYAGAIDTMVRTGKAPRDPALAGAAKVEEMMKAWISEGGVERAGIEGVPTKAAIKGVNHRLKHPYAKSNPRRPSFRDTGLMMGSYKAWVVD